MESEVLSAEKLYGRVGGWGASEARDLRTTRSEKARQQD
jgi:hypothetical protein